MPTPATPLHSRSAVVCGATQGIGRACAIELARLGAAVTIVGRNDEGLAKVLGELPREGDARHDSIVVDFADYKAVERAAQQHVGCGRTAHILVNNTGGPAAGPLIDARAEDLAAAFSQHILCNQVLAQCFAPGMRDAQYGRIINIVSTSVVTPIRGLGVSNTIRGAVGNWARTLAHELGGFGITVNNVLPGFTRTARLESLFRGRASRAGTTVEEIEADALKGIPAKRLAAPEEVAAVVAFLASPGGSYVNGVNLPVDGGRLAWQ